MKGPFLSRGVVGLVSLGLCAGLSRPPPKLDSSLSVGIVPNPLVLKILGRSQLEFVADLYWVRMANMAGRAVSASECGALLPIANLIADLAPRFKYPYFLGGVLAPVRKGRTAEYENVEGALALMARGVVAVPDYVRLHVQKAYTELELRHDPAAAGRTLRAASALPDAPPFLAKLAARLLAQAGQYDDARDFARAMATSEDPQLRADFELRLKQIDLEQVLVQVEEAARRYAKVEGHLTTSVQELIRKGFLPREPIDPFGGTIELTERGASSSVESRRLRAHVPTE